MRFLILVLISVRILFGLWSGISHAIQARNATPDRTAFVIGR